MLEGIDVKSVPFIFCRSAEDSLLFPSTHLPHLIMPQSYGFVRLAQGRPGEVGVSGSKQQKYVDSNPIAGKIYIRIWSIST